MLKAVITDYTFENLDIEAAIFESVPAQLRALKEKRPAADVSELVADADAVITQFAPVNADVIAAMQRARVIVRYGIGVDNVDLEAARARGIPVCNVPDYCIDEVADHTLAFLLAATRQVVSSTDAVRAGAWKLPVPLDRILALRDLTVGIVGFGRIGREVAARLGPFKCRVLVHDPVVRPESIEASGARSVALGELLASSDVITLHCPSNAQTRGMISGDVLARMKTGVILINVARGDLVDPDALTAALKSGQVAAAALDVFAPEPIPPGHPILKMGNVILSAHVASASPRAVRKLRETAAGIAVRALRGEPLPNVVNGVR